MKVQQVLQPHWLSFIYSIAIVIAAVADYASALQQPPPQLEPQAQRKQEQPTTRFQKQPQHAEVNRTAGESLSFGSKIVEYPVTKLNSSSSTAINATHHEKQTSVNNEKQQQQKQQQTIIQASDTTNVASASRVARRYDAPIVPDTQLVAQYDLPLVKKNRRTTNSTANSSTTTPSVISRSKQQATNSRSNSRDALSIAASLGQRSNSLGSQAQSNRQQVANRAGNSNVVSGARQQARRRDDRRSGVGANQQSSLPSVGTGSRREVNKSRKDVSATNSAPSATTTTSTSTPTTSVAVRPPSITNSIPSNPFSFFSPTLWGLSSPPKASSTKKPPKKYTPSPPIVTSTTPIKEKKNTYQKAKVTTTVPTLSNEIQTTTAVPKKSTTDGPFRIALPTFNLFNAPSQRSNEPISEKDKRNIAQNLRNQFDCPRESEVRFQLFPKICKTDEDCTVWNRDELCCEIFGAKSCVSGVSKPLEETSHTPILGLIPRKCPTRPLAELWWQVQECETDTDCWPRVCCPDGNKRYCRTSQPELETVPVPVKRSFNYLSEYLECTPPPPPIFDLHPKTCASTLDCFPNVCCQEAGLRHCRPPKKSLLTLMANFLNVDFVKKLAQNIVIK
ncbi:PREDICTED: mucin-5AC [Rhagoletis zephyria]|uniref:mucin-5AC n=1 Tax=Rhagoletis zephyria TaxID=28612 RepID=UPI00081157F6|nr:PREDICTED: mucin-5AC [Rhagoletis zephyria]